jgi:uncharacterized protein (DUF983 family)
MDVIEPATAPAPVRWQPKPEASAALWTRPGVVAAMTRGLLGRCPCCGQGALFAGWLRQVPQCAQCAAPLGAARADDAPPYIVIFIVAHLVIATQVMADTWLDLSLLGEAAIFLPATLALCLGLLRPIKGAVVGLIIQLGLVGDQVVQP